MIGAKLRRAREALHLIGTRATDWATRRNLVTIYRGLGRPDLRDVRHDLRLDFGGRVFSVTVRVQDLFVLGEILFERQYAVRSVLPERPLIVDAGANVGLSALWFLAHYPGARLHAFEPESSNFQLLEANVGDCADVGLYRCAVGSEPGQVSLRLGEFAATHSIKPGFVPSVEEQPVPLVRLDDHMREHGIARIDLLKLDVEGAEMEALAGLGVRLADVSVIVGELHRHVVDPPTFYGFLTDAGFAIVSRRDFSESQGTGVEGFEAVRRA